MEEGKNENDINKKIKILHAINSLLPRSEQLKIPSLITNDYINSAIYKIEENIFSGSRVTSRSHLFRTP